MMMPTMSKKRLFRAILGAALGVAILVCGAGTGARAADEEDDDSLDSKILRNVLQAIGLRQGDEANIEYRERSPLVVPPNRNLPPPDSNTAAAKNPTWPTDPEVQQRKKARAKRNVPLQIGDSVTENTRVLRPDELRGSGAPASGPTPADNRRADPTLPIKPSELGYKGGLFSSIFSTAKDEEYTTFTGETPRATLIEPPSGYRTPSPTQPYGVGKEKWTPPKVDRMEPVR